jgi:hypothetical protein
MTANVPSRWRLDDLYGYLGSATAPNIASGDVLPVAIVADYSQTSTGETILTRAYQGGRILAVGGQFAAFQLQAAGRALVVEGIRVKAYAADAVLSFGVTGAADEQIPSGNTIAFAAVTSQARGAALGGVEPFGLLTMGRTAGLVSATATAPLEGNLITEIPGGGDLRCLIEPNEALLAFLNLANVRIDVGITWREVAGRF